MVHIVRSKNENINAMLERKMRGYEAEDFLKCVLIDINVNDAWYKREAIEAIKFADIPEGDRKLFLATARAIKPNSFAFKKSDDKVGLDTIHKGLSNSKVLRDDFRKYLKRNKIKNEKFPM